MNIINFCGAVVCLVCVIFVVKQFKTDFHPAMTAAAGIVILVYIISYVAPSFRYMYTLASESGLYGYFGIMAKCVGIAFVCQAAAEICRDCGEASIASKVELFGKAAVLIQTVPIIKNLFDTAKDII